jgi:hypothetical protein
VATFQGSGNHPSGSGVQPAEDNFESDVLCAEAARRADSKCLSNSLQFPPVALAAYKLKEVPSPSPVVQRNKAKSRSLSDGVVGLGK